MLDVSFRHIRNRAGKESNETRMASIVHFRPGVSETDIARALKAIERVLDGPVTVNEFDPEWGSPVFYIP